MCMLFRSISQHKITVVVVYYLLSMVLLVVNPVTASLVPTHQTRETLTQYMIIVAVIIQWSNVSNIQSVNGSNIHQRNYTIFQLSERYRNSSYSKSLSSHHVYISKAPHFDHCVTSISQKRHALTTSISQKRHTLTIVPRPYLKSATLWPLCHVHISKAPHFDHCVTSISQKRHALITSISQKRHTLTIVPRLYLKSATLWPLCHVYISKAPHFDHCATDNTHRIEEFNTIHQIEGFNAYHRNEEFNTTHRNKVFNITHQNENSIQPIKM